MKIPPRIHSNAVQRLAGRVTTAQLDLLLLVAGRVDSTYFDAHASARAYADCLQRFARFVCCHDFSATLPNMDRLYELAVEMRERTHAFETLVQTSLPRAEAEAVLGAVAAARAALRAEQEQNL